VEDEQGGMEDMLPCSIFKRSVLCVKNNRRQGRILAAKCCVDAQKLGNK
jgi:hypothetical protein